MSLAIFQKTVFTKAGNGQMCPMDCSMLTPAIDNEGVFQATGILIMDLPLSSEALGKSLCLEALLSHL